MRTLTALLVCLAAAPAAAQTEADASVPLVPAAVAEPAMPAGTLEAPGVSLGDLFRDFGHDLTRLPTWQNAVTAGLGAVMAAAVHAADNNLSMRAAKDQVDDVFAVGGVTGNGFFQVGGAVITYALGHATGNKRVQHVGADLVQAQMLNGMLTGGIKLAAQRTRPDRGGYSFPSGHASGTFATATVLQRQFGWKVGLPAYTLAAGIAVSRVPENRHYASDVIFGAAIGIIAGRTVTVGRGAARFTVAPAVVQGGFGISFTSRGHWLSN